MCGEGVPDFYAKEVIGENPSCISPFVDFLLEPLYKSLGVCIDMNDYHYQHDENDDPLISDCLNVGFGTYYHTK